MATWTAHVDHCTIFVELIILEALSARASVFLDGKYCDAIYRDHQKAVGSGL